MLEIGDPELAVGSPERSIGCPVRLVGSVMLAMNKLRSNWLMGREFVTGVAPCVGDTGGTFAGFAYLTYNT
jgi:hypothetical protein